MSGIKTYNIMEFAELMGVSVKTLRRLDRSGYLVADRVLNNQYQYNDSHIDMFADARKNYLLKRLSDRRSLPQNLIDLRFGRLVVLKFGEYRTASDGRRESYWLCHCDCGNELLVNDNMLRAGYKKSCGCLLHGDNETKRMWNEYNSLSEDDVVKILNERGKFYNKKINIPPRKRVGGGPLEDLTGKQFGYWTVLYRGENRQYNKHSVVCWTCQCECGTIKDVPARDLKSGASQSCGCLSKTSWLEHYTKQYLIDNGFKFEVQMFYDDLRSPSGNLLYYDFLVFKNDIPFCLIECQGEQHFRPIKKFGGVKKFLLQQVCDNLKKDYACNVLNIPLYEVLYISMSKNDVYNDLDNIFNVN